MAPSARQVTCPGVRLPPARAEAPVPEIAELISRGRPCHGLGPACRPGTRTAQCIQFRVGQGCSPRVL